MMTETTYRVAELESGPPGRSNYELWLAAGNTGTLDDFLEAMRGPTGPVDTTTAAALNDEIQARINAIAALDLRIQALEAAMPKAWGSEPSAD